MKWIDEKIDEYGSKFYPTVGYNRYHEEADWLRATLTKVVEEARREERARIVKLLKRHKPSLIDCNIGWKHKRELDDLITQLSDK